jgi:hypothetical protein
LKRSLGKRIIVASAATAVVAMFLGWAEALTITKTGWQLSIWFLLVFWAYPVFVTTFNLRVSIKWGSMMALGSVVGTVIVVVFIAAKSGSLVKVDTGVGAWLFLLSGIALWIGTILYAGTGRHHPLGVDVVNDIEPRRDATSERGAGMEDEKSDGKLFSVGKTLGTLYGRLTGRTESSADPGAPLLPHHDASLSVEAIALLETRVINTESRVLDLQTRLAESSMLIRQIKDESDLLVLKVESYQRRIRNLTIGLGLTLLLSLVTLALALVRYSSFIE